MYIQKVLYTDQYIPVVFLLYKVVRTFESVDKVYVTFEAALSCSAIRFFNFLQGGIINFL